MAWIRSLRTYCALLPALSLAGLAFGVCGCGGRQTAEQALDKALERAGQKRQAVFPLAGRITIDGQPPQLDLRCRVFVVLIDRNSIDGQATSHRFVECDGEGKFAFNSYGFHDGVPPGSYVLAIAQLTRRGGSFRYTEPDQLHNLFNDPEKNAQKPEFQVEHAKPGKSDYELALTLAGVEPVETPGPHAITAIP
jgi:hypothetical protein